MRRILNLNQPAVIFVKLILLFIIAIPAVLYGAVLLAARTQPIQAFLLSAIRISFAVGILISVVLVILIAAEQIQDHYIDQSYQKKRGQKIQLPGGNYECQFCGNREVKEYDQICRVCGRELEPSG